MFALSRVGMEGTPAEAYLVLSEIDAKRPAGHRLSGPTVELMAGKFQQFRNQYSMFSEFPELSDASIAAFLTTAEALNKVSDHTLRGNAMGIFEANVMLWQILARQGEIPAKRPRRILAGNDQAVFPFLFVRPALRRRAHLTGARASRSHRRIPGARRMKSLT